MKLPKKAIKVLHFRYGEIWYQITYDGDKYALYRCEEKNDYTYLSTSNNPQKLEEKVYDGRIK